MMIHHSSESYEVAAHRAADGARAKLRAIIQQGQVSAQKTFAEIFQRNIDDALVRNDKVNYGVNSQGLTMQFGEDAPLPMTDHAFTQALARADISVPPQFARKLLGSGNEHVRLLLPEVVETLNRCCEDERRSLVRVVDGRVHAVLSDSYKRIDSRPQLAAFAEAAGSKGLVPMFGANTELRNHFRVILPEIYEPVPHEVMVFGLEWSDSDFGAGCNAVNMFILRLMCTNTAMAEKMLRQVHLGKQLDSIDFEEMSVRTRQLQAETMASAMSDLVNGWIDSGRVEQYCDVVRRAHEAKIDTGKALSDMYKASKINKPERDKLEGIAATQDVEILPSVGGESVWRFSNMFSYLAQQTVSPVRARELESLAGKVLADFVPQNNLRALPAPTAETVQHYDAE
jgi:hypothetical protein